MTAKIAYSGETAKGKKEKAMSDNTYLHQVMYNVHKLTPYLRALKPKKA